MPSCSKIPIFVPIFSKLVHMYSDSQKSVDKKFNSVTVAPYAGHFSNRDSSIKTRMRWLANFGWQGEGGCLRCPQIETNFLDQPGLRYNSFTLNIWMYNWLYTCACNYILFLVIVVACPKAHICIIQMVSGLIVLDRLGECDNFTLAPDRYVVSVWATCGTWPNGCPPRHRVPVVGHQVTQVGKQSR